MNLLTDINILDTTKVAMQPFIKDADKLKSVEPEAFHDDIDAELLDICRLQFTTAAITLYPGTDIEKVLQLSQEIDKKYLELMYV